MRITRSVSALAGIAAVALVATACGGNLDGAESAAPAESAAVEAGGASGSAVAADGTI